MRVTSALQEEFECPPAAAEAIAKKQLRLGPHAFRPAKISRPVHAGSVPIWDSAHAFARQNAVLEAVEKQAVRVLKYTARGYKCDEHDG